jgi:hypothetical protein
MNDYAEVASDINTTDEVINFNAIEEQVLAQIKLNEENKKGKEKIKNEPIEDFKEEKEEEKREEKRGRSTRVKVTTVSNPIVYPNSQNSQNSQISKIPQIPQIHQYSQQELMLRESGKRKIDDWYDYIHSDEDCTAPTPTPASKIHNSVFSDVGEPNMFYSQLLNRLATDIDTIKAQLRVLITISKDTKIRLANLQI